MIPLLNFIVGLVLIAAFVFVDLFQFKTQHKKELLETSGKYVKSQSRNLRAFTDHGEHVILSLRQNKIFDAYLRSGDEQKLTELFSYAMNAESYVMQLRFIGPDGMELKRFDRKNIDAKAYEVREKDLQNKLNRDYVQENIGQAERIWYSKLDLNVEHGSVEVPFKPTYRIVLPVWSEGDFKGMLIVNYFAQVMLDTMFNISNYSVEMIDKEGYILHSDIKDESWSRFVTKPFTVTNAIKKSISSSNVITDDIALMPLDTPFNNKLWLLLSPSKSYIEMELKREKERVILIAVIVIFVMIILNTAIHFVMRRLKLKVESIEVKQKLQQELLQENEKIVSMHGIIDTYVVTSNSDLHGKISDVSQAFCELTGYSKEELIGERYSILRDDDTPQERYSELWNTIKSDKVWKGEMKNRTKDKKLYWVYESIAPLYDKNGLKTGYTAIYKDITNEKLLEIEKEKLATATLRMSLSLKAAKIGLWEWDYATNELIWDERMHEIYGVSQTQVNEAYDVWSRSLDATDLAIVEETLNNAVANDSEFNASFWIMTPEKERRYILGVGKSVKNAQGVSYKMVGVNMDITEQKSVQDELEKLVQTETGKRLAQEKLLIHQSKLAAMGEMMTNIAHQWKQPLMILSMGLLALKKKYEKNLLDEEYMQTYNKKMSGIVDRMNQTILDFSEYFVPDKKQHLFELSSCVEKSVSFLEPVFTKSKITFDLDLPSESSVVGYENELSQVLLNLMKNSIDVIVENEISEGHIWIKIEEMPDRWLVSIRDNGGGIPADIIYRIFEPYFTTKFKNDGTGLGLYMSKMIVEQSLHGSLEVTNSELGAKFTIIIPKEK